MKIYLNEKEITLQEAYDLLNKRTIDKMIKEAKEAHEIDPLEQQTWYTGSGMIDFEF